MCLFLSLIFYIIRKKNALETTKKVSCSIIYFHMFAKSKFWCNFSRCFCFSPANERLAGEDGCNSGYCFGASESFVSEISVFSTMMFCWFMSWSGSVQVYVVVQFSNKFHFSKLVLFFQTLLFLLFLQLQITWTYFQT